MKHIFVLLALPFAAATLSADPATPQLLNPSTPQPLNSQLIWEKVPPTSIVEQVVQRYSTPGLSTNDVCNVVTNASTRWYIEQPSEWELYDTPAFDGMDRWWVRAVLDGNTNRCFSVGNEQSTRLAFYRTNPETLEDEEVFVAVLKTINTLGLARLEDVPDTSGITSSVNTMWSTLYGESVWLAVTNYLRQIAGTVPSLRLWEVRDGDTNMVYSSAEEIEHVTTQRVDAAERRLAAMMPRTAWGSYQSTGEDNPSSNAVTVINSPKIMLTGGGEWYRTIETGGGSVWVLKTSGLMTAGGDTNGYFRVVDAEGNAQIEVVKTADQIVDAVASDVDFDAAGNFTVTFNASGSSHPIVSCADDLGDVFYEEDSSGEINALGITVAWAKNNANLWTATLHQDERAPHLFVYGKVLMQGSNLVRNAAPTSLDGGLYINNVRYRLVPYTTGGKTYLTLEAW